MRFQVLDIVFNPPHPVTGAVVRPADRFERLSRGRSEIVEDKGNEVLQYPRAKRFPAQDA